jgi:hypothetical protein
MRTGSALSFFKYASAAACFCLQAVVEPAFGPAAHFLKDALGGVALRPAEPAALHLCVYKAQKESRKGSSWDDTVAEYIQSRPTGRLQFPDGSFIGPAFGG